MASRKAKRVRAEQPAGTPLGNDRVLVLKEVARIIGKKPSTVRYDMCRWPGRVPPFFKLPNSRKPLWLHSSVVAFMIANAAKFGAGK